MPGKYYEDLEIGARYRHLNGRTVTEADNVLFSALTMNPQALHLNEDFAAQTQFGHRIVNGIFTMGLVVGLSVADLTDGTIVANLSYERVAHPRPVFHGDTIYAETEVLDKRESQSNPDRGIVKLKQVGRNQRGEIVVELERSVMFLKRATQAAKPIMRPAEQADHTRKSAS
ncbi:MAG: MaoC family dehydratase [Aggregatilineales bacterium]